MRAVVERLIREYPEEHDQGEFGIAIRPARDELPARRPVLVILLGARGLSR
jgi:hypothetical protein